MKFWNAASDRSAETNSECFQCGLVAGKEYMAVSDDPIMHPHTCSWCKSVVYMPGPMFQCSVCNPDAKAA